MVKAHNRHTLRRDAAGKLHQLATTSATVLRTSGDDGEQAEF